MRVLTTLLKNSDARNKDFEDALTKGYRKEASSSTKTPVKKTRKTATKTQKMQRKLSVVKSRSDTGNLPRVWKVIPRPL